MSAYKVELRERLELALIIFNHAHACGYGNNYYFWALKKRSAYPSLITYTMENITDLFMTIIHQSPSIDIAESEFRKMLVDDPELRRSYREYCREIGSSERRGFLDFCDTYMESQDDVWNTLSDFDNIE